MLLPNGDAFVAWAGSGFPSGATSGKARCLFACAGVVLTNSVSVDATVPTKDGMAATGAVPMFGRTTLWMPTMRASMLLLRLKMSAFSRSFWRIKSSIRFSSASNFSICGLRASRFCGVAEAGSVPGVVTGELTAGVGGRQGGDRKSSTASMWSASICIGATALILPRQCGPPSSCWATMERFAGMTSDGSCAGTPTEAADGSDGDTVALWCSSSPEATFLPPIFKSRGMTGMTVACCVVNAGTVEQTH